MRFAWLVVLLVPIAVADAQQQIPRPPRDGESFCMNGYCIVTERTMEAIEKQLERTEQCP